MIVVVHALWLPHIPTEGMCEGTRPPVRTWEPGIVRRILKVFPCLPAFVVFCFSLRHRQIMRLPPSARKILDALRNELTRDIQTVAGQLRKIDQTIQGYSASRREADRARQEEERPTPEVRAILNAPEGIQTRQSREDAEQERRYQRRNLTVQWFLWVSTTLAFAAAAVYAYVAHSTLAEIQRQTKAVECAANAATDAAKTAKESLVSVQRAFVFLPLEDKGYPADIVGPQRSIMEVPIVLENSGTTPTRNLRFHINRRLSPNTLPRTFTFPDEWSPHEDRRGIPAILGPKSTFEASYEHIPVADIFKITTNQAHFYVWGWATYDDVFVGETKQHLTRLCAEVAPRDQPFFSGTQSQFKVALKYCNQNNCYDDECKN